jgi:phenylpropionate dioxygenase-like ring-hydroxylating dioxygenase large terminal subunit
MTQAPDRQARAAGGTTGARGADDRLPGGIGWDSAGDGTAVGEVRRAGPVRIPAHRYTSADFDAAERARMWPRTWQIACTVDHVPAPGDFFEYRVGRLSIVVVRDEEGTLRAFRNVCRHRGNSLCQGSGSGLTELRCGYHGWAWDLSGQLRRVPGRKGFGPLRFDELPLLPARAEEWGPFVFVNADPEAVPLAEYLEEVPGDLEWARLSEFRCRATLTGDVAANWKTVADGFSETYHIAALHPELLECVDDVAAPQRILGHTGKSEQDYGVASPRIKGGLPDRRVWDAFVVTQGARMGVTGPCPMPEIPAGQTLMDVIAGRIREHAAASGVDLSGYDTGRIMRLHQYNLFPNSSILLTADTLSVLTARPREDPDPNRARMSIWSFTRAASPDAPRTRPVDLEVTYDELDLGYVLNQDAAVLAGIQRGLNQPGMTEILLSQEERRIINTHRNLERYLGIGPED